MSLVVLSPCGHPTMSRIEIGNPESCRDCLAKENNAGPAHMEGRGYPQGVEDVHPNKVVELLRMCGIDATRGPDHSIAIPLRDAQRLAFVLHRMTSPKLVEA